MRRFPIGSHVIYRGKSYAFPGEVTAHDETSVLVKAFGDMEGNYSGMKHIYSESVLEPYVFGDTYKGIPPLVIHADENPFPKIWAWIKRHEGRLDHTPLCIALFKGLKDNLDDIMNDEPKPVYSVFDWSYTDPKTGRDAYAGTPERAEYLTRKGVKLTPVYTREFQPSKLPDWRDHEPSAPVELERVIEKVSLSSDLVYPVGPHHYHPSVMHMGDCTVCGHVQDSVNHIGTPAYEAAIGGIDKQDDKP